MRKKNQKSAYQNKSSSLTFLQQSKRGILNFLRIFPLFNSYENEQMTEEFERRIIEIKEVNSRIVYDTYYLPKAISAIFKEDNYLPTPRQAKPRATAMMFSDMANGVIDEFYRFV